MKQLTHLFRVVKQASELNVGLCNFVPLRGLKFQVDLKWVHPERKSILHPTNTGDLSPMPVLTGNTFRLDFRKSEELKTADENVKKIFSLDYQLPRHKLAVFKQELIDKVKRHPHDTSSVEARIAEMTAEIRFYQPAILEFTRNKKLCHRIKELIDARKKKLKKLRLKDYKRFEWLLEKLDLEYRPHPDGDRTITRKKSLVLLARLKIENQKEEKIAKLKQEFDEKKVPFLEKKLEKLKLIKDMEEKNNLTPTVTDADIEEHIQRIEKTKLEVAKRMKMGYRRKVHPYFLEVYNENLLIEKENQTRAENQN